MILKIISEMTEIVLTKGHDVSIRENKFWRYKRQDNSLFALASSLFVLKKLSDSFDQQSLAAFHTFEKAVISQYPLFRNKDNKVSYNFYPTKPSRHFGNGYIMRHFDYFRLPDDIDDTAMVFLTDSSLNIAFPDLVLLLEQHVHKTGVFNTWFGKNMPQEVDICANINMLLLFYEHGLQNHQIAENSMALLVSSIQHIESHSFMLARHYGNPVLILYHYARFMSCYPDTDLENYKNLLIQQAENLISKQKNEGHRMLLEICLLKWCVKRAKVNFPKKIEGFYTFIGAPLAPKIGANFFSGSSLSIIYWRSPLYQCALQIEYESFFKI
jgi:hypothetical protein